MGANFFPISFTSHITFCVIAIIFFLIQYIRLRYTYQLLTIVAVAGTLLLYLNDSAILFISKQRKQQEKEINKENTIDIPKE